MGWGNLVAEAVSEAQADMSRATAAAQAIEAAIAKVQPWLNGQTWTGAAADRWAGDWTSFYRQVQRCLGTNLPAAEQQVITQVRASMEQLAREHRGSPAPA